MSALIQINGDEAVLIPATGNVIITQDDQDVKLSYDSLVLWTDDDLAAVNVQRLDDPDSPAAGYRVTGVTPEFVEGAWVLTNVLELLDVDSERADALTTLADRRWQATQTFTYEGVVTPADSAISVVTSTILSASVFNLPSNHTWSWKLANNQFRTWTLADIKSFALAMNAHVQACFDNEKTLTTLIMNTSTPKEVDLETGWPS